MRCKDRMSGQAYPSWYMMHASSHNILHATAKNLLQPDNGDMWMI
jgi:hypothetical protein